MRLFKIVLLLLMCGAAATAQDRQLPEYGDISELKEKRKVYVTAELAISRKNVLSELSKYKGLEVVNSPDDAEFMLLFSSIPDSDTSKLSAVVNTTGGRQRVLWEEDESQSGLSKANSINLTRHFIKALKKARGEK